MANFSPVERAEISLRLHDKIQIYRLYSLKSSLLLSHPIS